MTNCIDKKQTMKRINDIIAMVGQVVMASCSPRVVADLDMMLPPRTADSLMIYEAADSMPAGAVKIGTVKAVDGMTLSKNCQYRQMLSLVADKTMTCGGNVLRIDKQRKTFTVLDAAKMILNSLLYK